MYLACHATLPHQPGYLHRLRFPSKRQLLIGLSLQCGRIPEHDRCTAPLQMIGLA